MLIALQHIGGYDHMLRIANRVDPDQYRKVSGFREPRMMDFCRKEFEIRGWSVETGIKISGPPQREIDVLANRGASSVLLQLKSTLRPEAPWEVFKRNQDIFRRHQAYSRGCQNVAKKPASFVITDGTVRLMHMGFGFRTRFARNFKKYCGHSLGPHECNKLVERTSRV